MVLKLLYGILHDNNYKIRMDGMLFLKDYLKLETVQVHQRFKSSYLPELIELLKDEEAYIRIEALDIMTDLLSQFEVSIIEDEYIPVVLDTIDIQIEEIEQKLAQMLGKIVYKLKEFDLHLKKKEPILEFYSLISQHKEIEMRRHGAYNLACFNSLYKEFQGDSEIDYQELYLNYSKEQDPFVKKAVAASLHEAFQLTAQDEDIFRLREAFKILLEDTDREVISVLCENIGIIFNSYSNDHGVKYFQLKMKDIDGATPISQNGVPSKANNNFDFGTVTGAKNSKEEKKGAGSKSAEPKKTSSHTV